jgi:hypothetical protein
MLSRTSISQTLYNLDLWFEPYHEYPVLRYYAAGKPLLLLQAREGTLSQNEKRLVERSALIDSNKHMLLFEFYPDSLEGILRDTELELRRELEAQREGDLNHEPEQGQAPEYYDDTTDRGYIYFESYRERPLGVFRGKITGKADFLNCTLPGAGRYVVSFWFKGTGDDLWPRTYYYVRLEGPDGSVYYSRRFDFFRRMVLRDGDWGLVEFFVDSELPSSVFTLSYQNVYLPRGEMIIDNVLVRPDGSKIRIYDGEHYGINNRYLPAR